MTRPPIIDKNSFSGMPNIGPLPTLPPVAAFNSSLTNNFLHSKSIEAYHIRSAPNPDRTSLGSPISPDSQTGSQRGFVYYNIRKLGVVPTSISLEQKFQVQALEDIGSVILNVTGTYLDECNGQANTVYVKPHDIIILNPSITCQTSQLFEYNPAGPQQLSHRVLGVDVLFDADRQYYENTDFVIQNGLICWLEGGQKPSFKTGKGAILSCVYYINHIYIVKNVPHHLRILPSNPIGHGALPRDAEYGPQLVICQPSTNMDESELLNFDLYNLPNISDYRASYNTTGGSL